MEYQMDRAWAEVSLDRLEENYRRLCAIAGENRRVMGVVKCDGYGHGAVPVARFLETLGAPFFGVATVEEAAALRDAGVRKPILVFGAATAREVREAAERGVALPAFDGDHARFLSEAAAGLGRPLEVHIKADSGLSRFGILLREGLEDRALREASAILAQPNLKTTGVFTHLASAGDPAEDPFTLLQIARFAAFTGRLAQRGIRLLRHCANSPGAIRFPQARFEMVRPGNALYGFAAFAPEAGLLPVMQLKARIAHLKWIQPGDTVGYGRLFTADRPTRIAILPFGYGDGLHRACANRSEVLVRGRRARLVGKLCMDMSIADVTDIPQAQVGDVVTLFGTDGEASLPIHEQVRHYPGTPTELTCAIGGRVPLFYLRGGKVCRGV